MSAILAALSPILTQVITAGLGAIVSGLAVHLYHTSGTPAVSSPAARAGGQLLANHPVLNQVLQEVVHDAEQAALDAVRARLQPTAPAAGVQGAPVVK